VGHDEVPNGLHRPSWALGTRVPPWTLVGIS
jgi:hypothetical protein